MQLARAKTSENPRPHRENRRRHTRFPLGLPVMLHLDGRTTPITVEVVDLSVGGMRLRALDEPVRAGQRGMLRFVMSDQRDCIASGRIARVDRTHEFVLLLEEANDAYHAFLGSLDPDTE